jgi:glucose/arabinose dehydrogenase
MRHQTKQIKATTLWVLLPLLSIFLLNSCLSKQARDNDEPVQEELMDNPSVTVQTAIGPLTLPPPYKTASARKSSTVIDWEDKTPTAPAGFTVRQFASDLKHPRWMYIAPNNDVFVAESNTRNSANQITLLRDTNGDGQPDLQKVFLDGLSQPLGMLVLNDYFYVANTGGLYRYPYQEGMDKMTNEGEKIVDLPASGYNNHWTRNIITNKEGDKIYITVGSASNVGEYGMKYEDRRAVILEVNTDGSGERIYASGLRNPVGADWNPVTGELWTAVNERDELGDNLVPDYLTSVQEEGWYGWPYSYYGQIKDPRWKDDPHEDKVEKAIMPDVPLGSHTASLGLAFYTGDQFPSKYKNGAFIGQHGSWNRSVLSGYKVVFVPFDDSGQPQQPEDFLTGFIANDEKSEVYGRPVGVTVHADGSLLVADDDSNMIWQVVAE